MKRLNLIFAVIFFLVLSAGVKAQTSSNAAYFAGKWNVLVIGTPNGDSKMIVNLEKNDTTLRGSILDTTNKEIAKITKIEQKDKSVTVYFTTQGYDVYLAMNRKDEDHFTGSVMDMFEAKGDRIK